MAFMARPTAKPVAEVQRKLHSAADEQLTKVLALVDALPARGEADRLIAPLRARLAAIEPARPMSITRLLFRPLDAVITTGPRWRPGVPAVPRTALPSIGNAVIAQLGGLAAPIQASISGQDGRDQAVVDQAGARLWPPAVQVVASLPCPADWGLATGLPEGCYPEIRANIAAVLHQAVPLSQRASDTLGQDPSLAVKAILTATQTYHPAGLGIVVAILLADGVIAAPVLLAAMTMPGGHVDLAVEQTLERAQHLLSTLLPSVSIAAASTQAMNVATLLDAIEGPAIRPPVRAMAQRTRQMADEACQGRLFQALDQDFLPRLAAAAEPLDDSALAALETAARGLRRLSLAGRRFGAGATYDRLLGRTAAGACASTTSTLTRMERLRLAEILVGSDAALALLPN